MDIKLDNGTVFSIEKSYNSLTIKKTEGSEATTTILTRLGCSIKVDDNTFCVI
jgi:hypothetical protein